MKDLNYRLKKLRGDLLASADQGVDPPVRYDLGSAWQTFKDRARPDKLGHGLRVAGEKMKNGSKRDTLVTLASLGVGYGGQEAAVAIGAHVAAITVATSLAATGIGLAIAVGTFVLTQMAVAGLAHVQRSRYKEVLEGKPSDEEKLKALVFLLEDGQLDKLYRSFAKAGQAKEKFQNEVSRRGFNLTPHQDSESPPAYGSTHVPSGPRMDSKSCIDLVWVGYRLMYWRKRLVDRLTEGSEWKTVRAALDLVKATTDQTEQYLKIEAATFISEYGKSSKAVEKSLADLPPRSVSAWESTAVSSDTHRVVRQEEDIPNLPSDGLLDWATLAKWWSSRWQKVPKRAYDPMRAYRLQRPDGPDPSGYDPLRRLLGYLRSTNRLRTEHVGDLNRIITEIKRINSRGSDSVRVRGGTPEQEVVGLTLSGGLSLAAEVFATLLNAGVSTSGCHTLGAAAGVGAGFGVFSVLGTLVFSVIANRANDKINIEFVLNPANDRDPAEKVKRLRSMLLQGRLKKMTEAFREVRSKMKKSPGPDDPVAQLQHLYAVQEMYVTLLSVSAILEVLIQTTTAATSDMMEQHDKAQNVFWQRAAILINDDHHSHCKGTCYKGRDDDGDPVHPLFPGAFRDDPPPCYA
jgi:hypothetical protein